MDVQELTTTDGTKVRERRLTAWMTEENIGALAVSLSRTRVLAALCVAFDLVSFARLGISASLAALGLLAGSLSQSAQGPGQMYDPARSGMYGVARSFLHRACSHKATELLTASSRHPDASP